jgi:hypothetical protein
MWALDHFKTGLNLRGTFGVNWQLFSRNTNKMQLCNRIYYSKVYWRLNMFRAAHRSSSGASNCVCSLLFIYPCGDRPFRRLSGQRPVNTWVYKAEVASTVYRSWWWAVCRSKLVEPSVNFGIINSITKLHLVGISAESSTMHGSMNIKFGNTNILIQNSQQDSHVKEFILSDNCSTCFVYYYHPSSGAQNNCNYNIWWPLHCNR